jgi:hypothetical protein
MRFQIVTCLLYFISLLFILEVIIIMNKPNNDRKRGEFEIKIRVEKNLVLQRYHYTLCICLAV